MEFCVSAAICNVGMYTYIECGFYRLYNKKELLGSVYKRVHDWGNQSFINFMTYIITFKHIVQWHLKLYVKVEAGFSHFREHVGGMKYARRNFKLCSDVNVHHGHIAGVQDDITTRCVPWQRLGTFGISPHPNLGHPASNTKVWRKTNEVYCWRCTSLF